MHADVACWAQTGAAQGFARHQHSTLGARVRPSRIHTYYRETTFERGKSGRSFFTYKTQTQSFIFALRSPRLQSNCDAPTAIMHTALLFQVFPLTSPSSPHVSTDPPASTPCRKTISARLPATKQAMKQSLDSFKNIDCEITRCNMQSPSSSCAQALHPLSLSIRLDIARKIAVCAAGVHALRAVVAVHDRLHGEGQAGGARQARVRRTRMATLPCTPGQKTRPGFPLAAG